MVAPPEKFRNGRTKYVEAKDAGLLAIKMKPRSADATVVFEREWPALQVRN